MPSYTLRKRSELRAPRRFDDPEEEQREVSYKECDVDEEQYRLTPPSTSRTKYRGTIVPFNPNLPPAAFPTLDPLGKVPDQRSKTFHNNSSYPGVKNVEGHDHHEASAPVRDLTESSSQGSHDQSDFDDRTPQSSDQGHQHSVDLVIRSRSPTPSIILSINSSGANSPDWSTMAGNEWMQARGLLPQHNGTEVSIRQDNMRRMPAVGQLSDHDRIVLELQSSDVEGGLPQPSQQVRWDDLTTPLKLQLYDSVSDGYSNSDSTDRLLLDADEVEELKHLFFARQRRVNLERDESAAHRKEVHDSLLRGALMSKEKFSEIANKNLFQHVEEEDEHYDAEYLSEPAELRKARAYLEQCRLPTSLLDRKWASIPMANAIALGCHQSSKSSAATTTQPQLFRKTPRDAGYTKSPVKNYSSLPGPSFLLPNPQRPRGNQPSPSRRPSGFIRPSIELGTTTVVQPRRPQKGNFIHRPLLQTRPEHVRARNAVAEADAAAHDRQLAELSRSRNPSTPTATARPPSAVRTGGEASTRSGVTVLKRPASPEPETSFHNSELRPGYRQLKPSMSVVNAELSSQITTTIRKKARTLGGSTKTDTPAPETVAPKEAPADRVVDTNRVTGSQAATSVERKHSNDSAVDLTADNEVAGGAKLAKDTPKQP